MLLIGFPFGNLITAVCLGPLNANGFPSGVFSFASHRKTNGEANSLVVAYVCNKYTHTLRCWFFDVVHKSIL